MKLTESRLKEIIKQEIQKLVNEQSALVDKRGGVRSGGRYELAGDTMSPIAGEGLSSTAKAFKRELKRLKLLAPKYKNEPYGDLLMDFYDVAESVNGGIQAIARQFRTPEEVKNNPYFGVRQDYYKIARSVMNDLPVIVRGGKRMMRLYKKVLQRAGADFFIDAGIQGIQMIRLAYDVEKAAREMIEPTGR